jgi:hypothetical protein
VVLIFSIAWSRAVTWMIRVAMVKKRMSPKDLKRYMIYSLCKYRFTSGESQTTRQSDAGAGSSAWTKSFSRF